MEAAVQRLVMVAEKDIAKLADAAARSLPDECEELFAVLQECDWNRREAARRLGVSDGTIRARIKKYNLLEPQVK